MSTVQQIQDEFKDVLAIRDSVERFKQAHKWWEKYVVQLTAVEVVSHMTLQRVKHPDDVKRDVTDRVLKSLGSEMVKRVTVSERPSEIYDKATDFVAEVFLLSGVK